MATCATYVGGFSPSLQVNSDPIDTCTGWILLDSADYASLSAQSATILPPLSIQDATLIGGGIVLTWAIAFGFVLVGRMLFNR